MNRILIIDDDRELCALIKRSVKSEHIEADFCNTGKEGLQKLKEQEYQLVLLDLSCVLASTAISLAVPPGVPFSKRHSRHR